MVFLKGTVPIGLNAWPSAQTLLTSELSPEVEARAVSNPGSCSVTLQTLANPHRKPQHLGRRRGWWLGRGWWWLGRGGATGSQCSLRRLPPEPETLERPHRAGQLCCLTHPNQTHVPTGPLLPLERAEVSRYCGEKESRLYFSLFCCYFLLSSSFSSHSGRVDSIPVFCRGDETQRVTHTFPLSTSGLHVKVVPRSGESPRRSKAMGRARGGSAAGLGFESQLTPF